MSATSKAIGGRRRLSYRRSTADCTGCRQQLPIVGGGLCRKCYSRAYRMRPEYQKTTRRKAGEPTVTEPSIDPACGTRLGYSHHRKRGETPCDECRAANTAAGRENDYKQHGSAAHRRWPTPGRLETNWADITAQQRRHAIRTCAAHAHTADELADYCAALGLNPKEGRP